MTRRLCDLLLKLVSESGGGYNHNADLLFADLLTKISRSFLVVDSMCALRAMKFVRLCVGRGVVDNQL